MNIQHLKDEYKKVSPNFMTPEILEHVITPDNRIIELSKGTGIEGNDIYGVTEFEYTDSRLETTRRGQMHTSKISARKHFNLLLSSY